MTRALSTTMATAIAARRGVLVQFIELAFEDAQGGSLYLTTAPVDVTWNGHTWLAVGGALTFEPFVESTDPRAGGLTCTLSGVDASMIGVLLYKQLIGRRLSIWYAHVNLGTNKALHSNDFANAYWTKASGCSIISDAIPGPDGPAIMADAIVENNTAAAEHYVAKTISITAGSFCTFSYFVRPETRKRWAVRWWNGASDNGYVLFRFDTGSDSVVGPSASTIIAAYGRDPRADGWTRLWMTFRALVGATTVLSIIEPADSSDTMQYTGITAAIAGYVAGAQFAEVAALEPYVEVVDTPVVAGQVSADPILVFAGFMNEGLTVNETMERGSAACDIQMRLSSRLATPARSSGIITNVSSHQRYFPGDQFFEYVPGLKDADLRWGTGPMGLNRFPLRRTNARFPVW